MSNLCKNGIMVCVILYCIASSLYGAPTGKRPLGGMSEEKPADNETQATADAVYSDIIDKAHASNLATPQFTAIKYTTQVVSGTNYFIKIQIGNGSNSYVHARVYEGFGGDYSLDGIELKHTLQDPITYIQPF